MAHLICDFKPVERFTIGAIGSPGQRVFLLQASQGMEVITLVCEKEQARALSSGLLQLLAQAEAPIPEDSARVVAIQASEMDLQPVEEPQFRIGQLGIGYDEESDFVVIVAYELPQEENQDIGLARFWATREQARALAQHAQEVVEAGRPICALCGRPIDPEGHSCPRSNGHGIIPEMPDPDV